MRRNLVVLGSTGSIGVQTLDVAARFPDRLRVYGLAARSNVERLREQIERFHPRAVAFSGGRSLVAGRGLVELLHGERGMVELATRPEVDLVVVGTVGRAGLAPALAALEAGKLVALANKEVLVMAGHLIQRAMREGGGQLVPIDSEHSAIWQCLQGELETSIETLTLTASGGALRDLSPDELERVTPEMALRHPTWRMGKKITVDCANLMNKGLEVIEARWLFDIPIDRIDIVLHPQSIVHSLVTFDDGSTKAQLGLPDMRLPIQYALSHPERWSNDLPRLDLTARGELTFSAIDMKRYPALQLALRAGAAGGIYPAVLSAADEVAVSAFLDGRISFTAIPAIIEEALDQAVPPRPDPDLEAVLAADESARRTAAALTGMERVR